MGAKRVRLSGVKPALAESRADAGGFESREVCGWAGEGADAAAVAIAQIVITIAASEVGDSDPKGSKWQPKSGELCALPCDGILQNNR